MEQYRVESGSVYRYSEERHAYLSAGKVLPGETEAQALKRIKEQQSEIELAESSGYAESAREYEESRQ